MKFIIKSAAFAMVLFVANVLHAQLQLSSADLAAIESTTPIATDQLPVIGTFYSAANPQNPPAPADVLGLPAWDLGSSGTIEIYLLDDLDTPAAVGGFHAMGAMDDSGPLPPGSGGGDGGYSFPNTYPAFPTNGLWLQITNISNGSVYANLNGATDYVYAVMSLTNLAAATCVSNWYIETEVFPGSNTNTMPFSVPMNGRSSLFLWAMDWTGVTANGNQTPQWWFFYWFGEAGLSLSDNTLDSSGNTLLSDYQNNNDPNVIQFYIEPASDYVNTTTANMQLYITAGEPAYYAVLVNGQTTTNWLPFTTSNIVVNLGPTDGVYNVSIGLKGIPTNATQTWQDYSLTLDRVPPILTVTNPISANATVIKPYLQLQGYANKPLSKLSYGISNAIGVFYGLPGYVTDQVFDTNQFDFTTNFFQCFDVPLTNGINNITLSVSDRAGNITTTNFNVILDYTSATNPPVVTLIWPQNGMAVSGTNITLRGTMSDETGTVVGQVVDQDGDTNILSGIVERNGMFWVENLPLTNGNNTVTVTATDAAGNVATTNITISESSVGLTINSTPTGDSLYQSSGTVYGTVSDPTAAVSVNGVSAVVDGSGNWEADNVPIYGTGTATFDAIASNSTTTANASSAVEMPAYAGIVEHHCNWEGSYADAYGDNNQWTHNKDYSAQYQPGTNGQWVSTYSASREDTDIYHNSDGSSGWYDDNYNWSSADGYYTDDHTETTSYNGNTYTNNYDSTNAIGSGLDEEGLLTGVPDESLQDGYGDLDYHYFGDVSYNWTSPAGHSSLGAHTEVKLYTGGKAGINRQSLFCLGCSAQGYGPPSSVGDQDTPWFDMSSIPINVTSLTVMGQHPGADGNLWVALPDNSPGIDITVTAPAKHYNAWASPTKYDLAITVNGIDLTTNTPTFIVGQQLNFVLAGLPMSQIVNMVGKWNLPGTFVNQGYQYSSTCYSYELNPTLLLNTDTTSCWYQDKPGGAVSVGMDLLFNNGQTVAVAANGSFNIVKPTIANLFGSTPTVSFDTNSDSQDDNSVQCSCSFSTQVQVPYPFSGQAQYVQLVQVNANYGSSILGVCSSTTDSTSGQFWLDNTDPYPDNGSPWSIAWNDNPLKYLQHSDVPGYGPTLCDSVSVVENFKVYLQFQPPGGIPVTIDRIDWGWQCNYTESGGVWSGGGSAYGPDQDTSDDSFPVWLKVYSNSR